MLWLSILLFTCRTGDCFEKMVTAFKNRKNVFTDTLAPQETNMMLVESATGMTSDILQKSFDAWFDATYRSGDRFFISESGTQLHDSVQCFGSLIGPLIDISRLVNCRNIKT